MKRTRRVTALSAEAEDMTSLANNLRVEIIKVFENFNFVLKGGVLNVHPKEKKMVYRANVLCPCGGKEEMTKTFFLNDISITEIIEDFAVKIQRHLELETLKGKA